MCKELPIEWDADGCSPPHRHGGRAAVLQMVVSFAVEFTLVRSPDKNFWVDVVDELVVEFRKL
jgi:hypothetical protein